MLSLDLRSIAVEGVVIVEPSLVPSSGTPYDLRANGSFVIAERLGATTRLSEIAPTAEGKPGIARRTLLTGPSGALKGELLAVVRDGAEGIVAVIEGATARTLFFAPLREGGEGTPLALPVSATGLRLALAALPGGGAVLIGAGESALLVARIVEGAYETPLLLSAPGRLP